MRRLHDRLLPSRMAAAGLTRDQPPGYKGTLHVNVMGPERSCSCTSPVEGALEAIMRFRLTFHDQNT